MAEVTQNAIEYSRERTNQRKRFQDAAMSPWQEEYADMIHGMSNEGLFAQARTLAMFRKDVEPMRWDVIQWKKEIVFAALEERLLKSGFLIMSAEQYQRTLNNETKEG